MYYWKYRLNSPQVTIRIDAVIFLEKMSQSGRTRWFSSPLLSVGLQLLHKNSSCGHSSREDQRGGMGDAVGSCTPPPRTKSWEMPPPSCSITFPWYRFVFKYSNRTLFIDGLYHPLHRTRDYWYRHQRLIFVYSELRFCVRPYEKTSHSNWEDVVYTVEEIQV